MKGYLIGSIDVEDPEQYEEYKQKAPGVIARFGGRYLVRGGEIDNVEGNIGFKRLVILEFPSFAEARRFYHSPEYQEIAAGRFASAVSHIALVEGCVDPTEALRDSR